MPKKEDFQDMMERNSKKQAKRKEGKKGKRVLLRGIFAVILLAAIAGCGWAYWQYRDAQKEVTRLSSLEGQQAIAQQEVQGIVENVKKHLLLPSDEQPSIATVTDADSLKEKQPFYKEAQNGDKVLIYATAKKAIIYSPDRDIIVNVGPIFVDEDATNSTDVQKDTTKKDETTNTEIDKESTTTKTISTPSPTPKPTKEATDDES